MSIWPIVSCSNMHGCTTPPGFNDELKLSIERRLAHAPKSKSQHFPEVLSHRNFDCRVGQIGEVVYVIFANDRVRKTISHFADSASGPLPGLFTPDYSEEYPFCIRVTNSEVLTAIAGSYKGNYVFSIGPDVVGNIYDAWVRSTSAEGESASYPIPLLYFVSKGRKTYDENLAGHFDKIIAFSINTFDRYSRQEALREILY